MNWLHTSSKSHCKKINKQICIQFLRKGLAPFVCRWHFLMQWHSNSLREGFSLGPLYNTSHWFYLALKMNGCKTIFYDSCKERLKSLGASSTLTSITVKRESLLLFLLGSRWPKPLEGSFFFFFFCHQCLLVCCHGNCSWWWPLLSGSLMNDGGG